MKNLNDFSEDEWKEKIEETIKQYCYCSDLYDETDLETLIPNEEHVDMIFSIIRGSEFMLDSENIDEDDKEKDFNVLIDEIFEYLEINNVLEKEQYYKPKTR